MYTLETFYYINKYILLPKYNFKNYLCLPVKKEVAECCKSLSNNYINIVH